jgi:hypothetical protein
VRNVLVLSNTIFVSQKVIFEKLLSKLSRFCLPLGKLVNGKHFQINGKHFPVKEKFGLVFRKVFFILAVFVFRKVVSGKSLSKLFYVCLLLEKLVNGKYFSVNVKYFSVNEKHFPVKKNLVLFSGKCFSFGCVCFPESGFRKITFQTFMYLFAIRKVGQQKTFFSQRKIWLSFQESVFLKNLG